MTKLVLVESPAKTQKISSFLGPGYKVLASFGHIRALEESLAAVGLDTDFSPKYTFLKEKGKAIAAIREAAASATEVILASDDDREGEAIAYSIAVLLKLPTATTKRAVFHEITKQAVTAAVANPRTLDMNRVYAQQSRAMLDMMVGFTISPLLWKYVGPGLSAGRCQTPALRFVCDRETEIETHTTQTTWAVTGSWQTNATPTAPPSKPFPASLIDELADQESAEGLLEIFHGCRTATITKATLSPWTTAAPPPLITSTLQQEASALYKCNPKSTMRAAQRLYEAGHITYMRTDCAVLSEEAAGQARTLVETRFGVEFVAPSAQVALEHRGSRKADAPPKKTTKKTQVAPEAAITPQSQEAHEAIRPTHFELEQLGDDADWSKQEQAIYRLIWLRAVQSVMAAARGEQKLIQFTSTAADAADFSWQAKWRRTTFAGWKALGVKAAQLDDADSADEEDTSDSSERLAFADAAWAVAAPLTAGVTLQWQSIQAQPRETKAAGRYTEATLVRELERKGIGRPSTFASLIASIQDKGYVETKDIPGRKVIFQILSMKPGQWPPAAEPVEKMVGAEKGKLVPTALGRSALAFALQHFADLFDYSFTAQMERQLDAIAAGAEPWKKVLRGTWDSYSARYAALKDAATGRSEGLKSSATAPQERVRDFGGGFKAVLTKKGPLLLQEAADGTSKPTFYGWPGRKAFHDLTEQEARNFAETKKAAVREIVVEQEAAMATSDSSGSSNPRTPSDIHISFDSETTATTTTAIPGKIIKKQGKYGWYAECDGIRISCQESDDYRTIATKLAAKAQAAKPVRIGPYEFRVGPYGPYMFKAELKTKKFVSVPKDTDVAALTVKAADALYKAGLEAATNKAKFKKSGSSSSNTTNA